MPRGQCGQGVCNVPSPRGSKWVERRKLSGEPWEAGHGDSINPLPLYRERGPSQACPSRGRAGICRKKRGDLQVNGLRAKTEVGTIGYVC